MKGVLLVISKVSNLELWKSQAMCETGTRSMGKTG